MLGIIEPGGIVLIGGINFGTTKGIVRMVEPGASWDLLLEKLEWYPTGIAGRIPNNPALVKGTGIQFVVETSNGKRSNGWPVNWTMEIKRLSQGDVAVDRCSRDANWNSCNGEETRAGCIVDYWDQFITTKVSDGSIGGWHSNCWGTLGDDSGVDTYQVSLKNGWVLYDFEFGSGVSSEGEGWVTGPGQMPVGATSWKPKISWSVTPSDQVKYWAFIYIRGPKGVSHSAQYPGGAGASVEH
jgi:hypothetical protein